MLALRANRTVSADELIDGLWGDRPPASAAKNLQSYVSRVAQGIGLRRRGGRASSPAVAATSSSWRRTRSTRCASSDLVEEAARESSGRRRERPAGAALELWRGAPLADVASEPFAGPEIGRLEELHLRAIELAIDAELAAGRHAEVIARLEALIAEQPLHERLHAQRMLALYRAGRQSEALEAYREARAALIEQIGVEPGPELRACRSRSSPRTPPSTRRRRPSSCRVQLEGGSPLLAGRERELRLAAQALGAGARGPGRLRDRLGAGGDRQDASRRRARDRGPAQRAPRSSTPAAARSPEAALATVAEAGTGHRPTLLVLDYADDAPPARARGRRRARPRARGSAAHGLRPAPRRAGPAGLRRPARAGRPAAAPRPAARRGRRRDRRALRAGRGRRDPAARR